MHIHYGHRNNYLLCDFTYVNFKNMQKQSTVAQIGTAVNLGQELVTGREREGEFEVLRMFHFLIWVLII